ncbi:glutathione transferase [Vulgatibacter sp.]|uniref:glutathione transferase n=1 Tax=Vulgatibacter sp. TaxID=1971226 RepID=UPI00356A9AA4
MEELVLYGDRRLVSPWVLSVWISLREKGLIFGFERFDLARRENRGGAYEAKTLTGKVPGLRHGETWLAESLAILLYLEDAFPTHERMLPSSPRDRARDLQALSFLRSDLGELRRSLPFEGVVGSEKGPGMSEGALADLDRLLRVVATRAPLAGRAPTLADYELAVTLRRPIHHGVDIPEAARRYSDELWERPSVQSWVRHPERGA